MGANSFELSLITGMSEAGAAVKGEFRWNESTMAWTLLWRAQGFIFESNDRNFF